MMDFTAQPEADDEPISVVPFPVLSSAALYGLPGKIVESVAPYTEAHPAAILVQLLSRFGATIGNGAHILIANRPHPARLWPLIVGKTSDGAKGTSYEVVAVVFSAAEGTGITRRGAVQSMRLLIDPLRRISGLSSGEGLIELVRDANGTDPTAKDYDEGVTDKRLLVVESEFAGTLAVMERQGSNLPRIFREAWDGDILSTLTRKPLVATDAHISILGHVSPGELRLRLKDAQLLGGTMNRMVPVASRRTQFLPDGGNIPKPVLDEFSGKVASAVSFGTRCREVGRTPAADELWREAYTYLRRSRPDGPVASLLARSAPQVSRLALAYALFDESPAIDHEHLAAAVALWRYVERSAEWLFGGEVDAGEVDALVSFIAAGGPTGRTRTQIVSEHYGRNRSAAEVDAALGELLRDGRVRQETDKSGRGRPTTRFYAC